MKDGVETVVARLALLSDMGAAGSSPISNIKLRRLAQFCKPLWVSRARAELDVREKSIDPE